MAQHVFTGMGPPAPGLQATPGAHYVDLQSGRQLFYANGWVEGGGGGTIAVATHDFSAQGASSLKIDPTVANYYIADNIPPSPNKAAIDLELFDPYGGPNANKQCVVEVTASQPVEIVRRDSGLYFVLHGATFTPNSADVPMDYVAPANAGDTLRFRFTHLGAGMAPLQRLILVEVMAVSVRLPARTLA